MDRERMTEEERRQARRYAVAIAVVVAIALGILWYFFPRAKPVHFTYPAVFLGADPSENREGLTVSMDGVCRRWLWKEWYEFSGTLAVNGAEQEYSNYGQHGLHFHPEIMAGMRSYYAWEDMGCGVWESNDFGLFFLRCYERWFDENGYPETGAWRGYIISPAETVTAAEALLASQHFIVYKVME